MGIESRTASSARASPMDSCVRNVPAQIGTATNWQRLAAGSNLSLTRRATARFGRGDRTRTDSTAYSRASRCPLRAVRPGRERIGRRESHRAHQARRQPVGLGIEHQRPARARRHGQRAASVPGEAWRRFLWSAASAGSSADARHPRRRHALGMRHEHQRPARRRHRSAPGRLDANRHRHELAERGHGEQRTRSPSRPTARSGPGARIPAASSATARSPQDSRRFRSVSRRIGARSAGNGSFSIAMKTNGTLWTWGEGTNGQLGDGGGSHHARANRHRRRLEGDQRGVEPRPRREDQRHALGLGIEHQPAARRRHHHAAQQPGADRQRHDLGDRERRRLQLPRHAHGRHALDLGREHRRAISARARSPSRSTPGQVGTSTGWSSLPQLQSSAHSLAHRRRLDALGIRFCHKRPDAHSPGGISSCPISRSPRSARCKPSAFTAPPTSVPVGNTITLSATTGSGLPASYIVTGPATRQAISSRSPAPDSSASPRISPATTTGSPPTWCSASSTRPRRV